MDVKGRGRMGGKKKKKYKAKRKNVAYLPSKRIMVFFLYREIFRLGDNCFPPLNKTNKGKSFSRNENDFLENNFPLKQTDPS